MRTVWWEKWESPPAYCPLLIQNDSSGGKGFLLRAHSELGKSLVSFGKGQRKTWQINHFHLLKKWKEAVLVALATAVPERDKSGWQRKKKHRITLGDVLPSLGGYQFSNWIFILAFPPSLRVHRTLYWHSTQHGCIACLNTKEVIQD